MRELALEGAVLAALCGLSACAPVQPALSDIQAEIFDHSCAFNDCHNAVDAAGGLVLEDGVAWMELVGVEAEGDPDAEVPSDPSGRVRVVPGDPDLSYIIDKLEGTLAPNEGARMPDVEGVRLRRAAIEAIREWIALGALDD